MGDQYGISNVRAYGAKGNGVADDTLAIQSAIDASDGVVWIPPGTYNVTGITIPKISTVRILGAGRSSILKAAVDGCNILTVGSTLGGSAGWVISIDGLTLDGASRPGVTGLLALAAHGLKVSNIWAWRCANGIYLRGETNQRMLVLSFSNCITQACVVGVRMTTPTPPVGCFTIFGFSGHSSESDGEGFSIDGGGGEQVLFDNTEIQASSVVGLRVSNAHVSFESSYIECPPAPTAILTNGAVVISHNSVFYKPQIDATSSVSVENSYTNEVGRPVARSYKLGRQSDDTGWGSPIYPVGAQGKPGGAVYERGFVWVDAYGVEWTCTTPGVSGEARFAALGGRIVIPIDAASLSNGNTFWYPSEDFVLTGLDVVVTEAFVPGTATWASLGIPENPTGVYQYISQAQGAAANWVRGVMTAAQNAEPYAALTGGRRLLLEGRTIIQGPTVANRIGGYTNGTWTAGAGFIVVSGYYPEYN